MYFRRDDFTNNDREVLIRAISQHNSFYIWSQIRVL